MHVSMSHCVKDPIFTLCPRSNLYVWESRTLAAAMALDSSSSDQDRDWENLLREVLTLIAKRLAPLDYANFSDVCKSWASVASPENGMPPPLSFRSRRPYLLLPGGDGEQSESCTLVDGFDNNYSYRIDPLPEIRGKWCVGSQFGWLAVIDELSNPSLLNPFSRSQIDLPPITTLPNIEPVYDANGAISGYLYDGDEPYSLVRFRDCMSINKIVLSSNPADGSFTAVALLGSVKLPIFTRSGEGKWNLFDLETQEVVVDAIYYDDKLLMVTNDGNVFALDLPEGRHAFFAKTYNPGWHSELRYLVDFSGVLVHVCRRSDFNEVKSENETYEIEVRSFDSDTGTWIPLDNLGDHSFFVGTCCSFSVLARGIPGLKENCIYLTDNLWDLIVYKKEMARDIGVFDLSDGSITKYYPPDRRLTWPPPIWIASPIS